MQGPLSLELGGGFTEGEIEDSRETFAFIAQQREPFGAEVRVATAGLDRIRALGPLPGTSIPAGGLVVTRKLSKAIASAAAGLCEYALDGSGWEPLVGCPELAPLTQSTAVDAYGPPRPGVDFTKQGLPPLYTWVLEVDEATSASTRTVTKRVRCRTWSTSTSTGVRSQMPFPSKGSRGTYVSMPGMV